MLTAVLESAIANAENNHNLDVDSLVVAEAYVGKNLVMKRFRARAKGRGRHPSAAGQGRPQQGWQGPARRRYVLCIHIVRAPPLPPADT